ncbi:MAG: CinA family protein [Termitinemataceae bacterium]|nr:MAG: CinA family protein [Termitinemataceae bacterium]
MAASLHNNSEADIYAQALLDKLKNQNRNIVFAESCTAGLLAGSLARIPGASSVLWGAYVTYTLDAKNKMLNVCYDTLEKHGAVSRETALSMAINALKQSGASIAVSVTGLAGPLGDGTPTKVGTVWIAYAEVSQTAEKTIITDARCFMLEGDRQTIRNAAVIDALKMALDFL